jgi:hypothetical protein
MVKRRARPAMVDGRLRSGVNGAAAGAFRGLSIDFVDGLRDAGISAIT